jgi:hypothetical protein
MVSEPCCRADDGLADHHTKKKPPLPAACEVSNREASNRVDRSHSVSNKDDTSDKGESLIVRKRAIFFREH